MHETMFDISATIKQKLDRNTKTSVHGLELLNVNPLLVPVPDCYVVANAMVLPITNRTLP